MRHVADAIEQTDQSRTLAAARRGDREACAALLSSLQDTWYRLCLGLLGNADAARDATQETALRFLRQIEGFRGDSQLRTWSLGIAINVVREVRRRSQKTMRLVSDLDEARPLVGGEAEPAPHAAAALSEMRDRLHLVLAELPDRQREAIVLRFFEELSVEETAAAMQCAEGTVKATVHQALRSLRQRLGQLI